MMRELTCNEQSAVSGAGFFEDLGRAIGSFMGDIYDKETMEAWQEHVMENMDEIVAADSSGML